MARAMSSNALTTSSKDTKPVLHEAGPKDSVQARTRGRWFRRSGGSSMVVQPVAGDSKLALLAELMVLREENASLKAAQHQGPSVGRLLEQVRALPSTQAADEDIADETAQMLVETMVMRESLIGLVQEVERSMTAVGSRLGAMSTTSIVTADSGYGR